MNSQDLEPADSGTEVPEPGAPDPTQQTFVSHLVELRDRLLRALACVFVVLLVLMPFANEIYVWLAEPLLAQMPGTGSMIATQVASPFLAPFKLALFVAVFISVPFIFYQAWAFVAPGLYLNERRLVLPLLVSSTLLFYCGVAFAYFAVFPLVFGFFTAIAPEGVTIMTDISHYLDFVLKLFLAFGVAFEVPVATYLIVRTGLSTVDALAAKRPYIIVGTFSIGMLLTPPDIISQILLAVPMWMLYELGLVLCRMTLPEEEEADSASTEQTAGTPD
ncbi:MAG: twin-arginine translocase subunit TatC [Gammaproteobacteria bacterium]